MGQQLPERIPLTDTQQERLDSLCTRIMASARLEIAKPPLEQDSGVAIYLVIGELDQYRIQMFSGWRNADDVLGIADALYPPKEYDPVSTDRPDWTVGMLRFLDTERLLSMEVKFEDGRQRTKFLFDHRTISGDTLQPLVDDGLLWFGPEPRLNTKGKTLLAALPKEHA